MNNAPSLANRHSFALRQRGMGMWGLLLTLLLLGVAALIIVKTVPIYLNQLKVSNAVTGIVKDSSFSQADPFEIRRALQRKFDVEAVEHLQVKDVKIKRVQSTRRLSYDYQVQVSLFANISLLIQFKDSQLIRT